MKTWVLAVLSLIVGVGVGVAAASLRLSLSPWKGEPVSLAAERMPAVEAPSSDKPQPRVKVDQEVFDFGAMDVDAEGTHQFTFTNVGESELELTLGATTCKCTLSDLSQGKLGPGESAKVTLTWHATAGIGHFEQTATVHTNDPERPRIHLQVVGSITAAVRIEPKEAEFSRLSPNQPATRQVRIYGYEPEKLAVSDVRLESRPFSEFFSVTHRPLTESQLSEEAGAHSGVLLTITAKPGLPLGPVKQKILLKSNYPTHPELEIPVVGVVGSDISFFGPGWNQEKNVLNLGILQRGQGVERTLYMIARGPHRGKIKLKVVRTDPEFLQVEIGPTVELNQGATTRTPVTIRVPADAPAVNRLGTDQAEYGEILIDTNHPEAPQWRILVGFAVEG